MPCITCNARERAAESLCALVHADAETDGVCVKFSDDGCLEQHAFFHTNAFANVCVQDVDGASALYERVLFIEPNNVETFFNYARMVDEEANNPGAARDLLRRALGVDPTSGMSCCGCVMHVVLTSEWLHGFYVHSCVWDSGDGETRAAVRHATHSQILICGRRSCRRQAYVGPKP